MQFVDECKLLVKAGNGGRGIVAWRREDNVPEGGPWGGDGGKGGDIIIVGNHNADTLFDLRNKKTIIAQNGDNGQTQNMSGRNAKDIFIDVPLGTTIYDAITNELLCDILETGQKYIICHGGRGGHGNTHFKSSFNRVPTLHENGDLGETKNILLKLRYVADVGLVGLPNAGKSTLISKISNASPKIANYQFTTLTPVLGIVKIKDQKLVFEDVPGLIAGASAGKGLGHEFLKHIERCHILIHLISLSASDNDDIINSFQTIVNELTQYSSSLQNKPIILVGNKIDTDDYEQNLQTLEKKLKTKILVISAKENMNIDKLLNHIYDKYIHIIQDLKDKLLASKEEAPQITKLRRKDEKDNVFATSEVFKIRDGVYEAKSDYLDYWFHKIPLDTPDNIIRFNQKIESSLAEQKAKKMGAIPKDTLIICGTEFDIE